MTGVSATTQLMSDNTATNKATTNLGYDAAGNVLNDSMHAYQYDADGNLLTVSNASYSTTYYYDSLNNRVRADGAARGTWEFLFDAAGRRVSTWALKGSTSPIEVLVYGDSKLPVALRNSSGTSFEHYNWLGTKRMITTYSGAVEGTIASLPFGDGETLTGTNPDWSDFASLDGDGESNTEHAQFRQYSGNQGRWLSPDPYLGSYDFTNPQSFNRYAYVQNNPVGSLDPSGLNCAVGVSGCAFNCANDPNCDGQAGGSAAGGGTVDGVTWSDAWGGPPPSLLGGNDFYSPGDPVDGPPWYSFINGDVYAEFNSPQGVTPDGYLTLGVNLAYVGSFVTSTSYNLFGSGSGGSSGSAPSNQCMSVNGQTVCKSPADAHNFLHGPNTIHYRDSNANCSTHVVVNSNTGQVVESHIDEYNPNFDLFNHTVLDVIPDLIYDATKLITGTGVYPIPPGRSFCQP